MPSNYVVTDIYPRKGKAFSIRATASRWTGWVIGMMWRVCLWLWRSDLRDRSRLIERYIERCVGERNLFLNETVLRTFPMKKSHSHPSAAAYRSSVNTWMTDMVRTAGKNPYHVSRSAQDMGRGSRYFYGLKDLAIPFSDDDVTDRDVLVMCDVDYYADMNGWMKYFRPIIMYTLVPTTVVGRVADYAYRFCDNEVDFHVAGGSSYRHSLWDYSGDYCSVVDDEGRLCVFLIEQRNIPGDEHHRYVVLTPSVRIPSPYYLGCAEVVELKRKIVCEGKVNMLYDPLTDKLSVSENGAWQSVNITGEVYSAIQRRLMHKESATTVADIERLLQAAKHAGSAIDAPILYSLMGATLRANVVRTNGSISYLPIGSLATEDGVNPGRQVTTPLVTQSALFPEKSRNADEATVRGRVQKVKNDTVPLRKYFDMANEFVLQTVGTGGEGVPHSVEEVRIAQDGKQQRARFEMVKGTLTTEPQNRLKSFIKTEAYDSVNDPRNITTMAPDTTILLSRYTLPFKAAVLKKHKWYGPGMTPNETIQRLGELFPSGTDCLAVDYSRLDGSVSEFLQRNVVMAAYMRWVNDADAVDLRRDLMSVFIRRGVTATGLAFDPGFGTRSGSPITTDGNTMICAFVVYAAQRRLGKSAKEAFRSIGLIYGDDGAIPAARGVADAMEAVAKDLGLTLKANVVASGEPIPYLGRLFINPSVMKDSYQDPRRTIAKLHLSGSKGLTKEQAACNKASGYINTDALTPIIGTWCRRVLAITGLHAKNLTHEEQYKMSNAWPQSDLVAIRDSVAKTLGIESGELVELDRQIELVEALDHFPLLLESVVATKIAAVVGGEVREPELHQYEPKPDDQSSAIDSSLLQLDTRVSSGHTTADSPAAQKAKRLCDKVRGPRPRLRPGQSRGRPQKDRGAARNSVPRTATPKHRGDQR